MTFVHITDDEILIRHYNNYLWFKQNGEALIEEMNHIYDNLENSYGSTYTIRRKNYYNKIGDKIKITDFISSKICIIIDNLSITDFKMLYQCQYTIYPNTISASGYYAILQCIRNGLSTKRIFSIDLKKMKYNIKSACLNEIKFANDLKSCKP